MFNISQTAIEQAVRDIRNGVTYPDFWTDRCKDEKPTEQAKEGAKEESKEEKKAAQA